MSEEERAQLLALLSGALTLVGVILAANPDLPHELVYRFKLWHAYRQTVNYDKLLWMRHNLKEVYGDDR